MDKLETSELIIAGLYILYGIIKISLGLTVMIVPTEDLKKTKPLKSLAKHSEDKTFAGRFYEYVLLAFGVYTIIYGLNMLHFFPDNIYETIDRKETEYTVFIILGLLLTIVYALVLYTDAPISKDMKFEEHYKVLGLLGGLSFLVMPLIWEMVEQYSPWFKELSLAKKSGVILSSTIITLIIVELVYKFAYKKSLLDMDVNKGGVDITY